MKTNLTLLALAAFCLSTFAAEPTKPSTDTELFRAGEITLDLAATYSDRKAKFDDTFDHSARGGTYGLSLGGAYWLTKNFAVGADAVVPDYRNVDNFIVGNANVSVIARLPLGSFAPYAFGGGGRNFAAGDYTAHGGAGVECRFTKNVGAFAEGRYVWAFEKSPEYAQARAGIRLAF